MGQSRCICCGDIVGVYEPARLLLTDGTHQQGSPLTLGEQLAESGGLVFHERCYQTSPHASVQDRVDAGA